MYIKKKVVKIHFFYLLYNSFANLNQYNFKNHIYKNLNYLQVLNFKNLKTYINDSIISVKKKKYYL